MPPRASRSAVVLACGRQHWHARLNINTCISCGSRRTNYARRSSLASDPPRTSRRFWLRRALARGLAAHTASARSPFGLRWVFGALGDADPIVRGFRIGALGTRIAMNAWRAFAARQGDRAVAVCAASPRASPRRTSNWRADADSQAYANLDTHAEMLIRISRRACVGPIAHARHASDP